MVGSRLFDIPFWRRHPGWRWWLVVPLVLGASREARLAGVLWLALLAVPLVWPAAWRWKPRALWLTPLAVPALAFAAGALGGLIGLAKVAPTPTHHETIARALRSPLDGALLERISGVWVEAPWLEGFCLARGCLPMEALAFDPEMRSPRMTSPVASAPLVPSAAYDGCRPPHRPGDECTSLFRRVEPYRYEVTVPNCPLELTPDEIASQGRIVPAFLDGKPGGFRLVAPGPRSFFIAAGFEDQDVLVSVDGRELTSPDETLEAYTRVRTKSRVSVDVLRHGRRLQLIYDIWRL